LLHQVLHQQQSISSHYQVLIKLFHGYLIRKYMHIYIFSTDKNTLQVSDQGFVHINCLPKLTSTIMTPYPIIQKATSISIRNKTHAMIIFKALKRKQSVMT
jgi:hypothetical protein